MCVTKLRNSGYRFGYYLLIVALVLAFQMGTPAKLWAQAPVHVVQPGDSLSAIAVRYGVSMSALMASNGIGNSDYVEIGQRLTIPTGNGEYSYSGYSSASTATGTVTVGAGDSLSLIAAMHGMTVQELMTLNGLTNPNHVWIGQTLYVSGNSSSTGATAGASSAINSSNGLYHVVQAGESLSSIAAYHGVSQQAIMDANGLYDPNRVQLGQRLYIVGAQQRSANYTYAPAAGQKRIVVDLSDQTLTAFYGESVALYTSISSGTWATPTITGYYKIDRKYPSQRMFGPGYDIPNVPWVMYFWDGYAFHGAYWHNNFGAPMSHGCVHLRPGEAEWLYNWAAPGTDVYINW